MIFHTAWAIAYTFYPILLALGLGNAKTISRSNEYSVFCSPCFRAVLVATCFFVPFFAAGFVELLMGVKFSIFALFMLELIISGILFRAAKASSASKITQPSYDRTLPAYVKFLILCGALSYLFVFALLLLSFPRGFEPNAYHLPIAVHYLQRFTLLPWDTVFFHQFPANMSIYEAICLAILPQRLVSLSNLLWISLLAAATFDLSRQITKNSAASSLSTLGMTLTPMIMFSSLELGADIAGLFFLTAATCLALSALETRSGFLFFLAGCSSGLAFGFKSLHIIGAASIGCLLLFGYFTRKTSISTLVMFVLGIIATASYWLVRNYILWGNPIFPADLAFLGMPGARELDKAARLAMQHQWVKESWQWIFYPWFEWQFGGDAYKHSSGLGPFNAALMLPALILTLAKIFRRRTSAAEIFLFLGGTLILIVWWILGDRQPRYALGVLVFWSPLVAHYLSDLGTKFYSHTKWICVISTIYMCFVLTTTEAIKAADIVISGLRERHDLLGYPDLVDRLPSGSVIGNFAARPMNFPLFGANLQNRVISGRELIKHFKAHPDEVYEHVDKLPASVELNSENLKKLGLTHIHASATTRFVFNDNCSQLETISERTKNPINGVPLHDALSLYRLIYCGS